MLPLAHVGHYLWVLYIVPVLIVAASIVKTTMTQRRTANAPPAGGDDREDSPARESPRSETGPAGRAADP
jgi:hypothetical protein